MSNGWKGTGPGVGGAPWTQKALVTSQPLPESCPYPIHLALSRATPQVEHSFKRVFRGPCWMLFEGILPFPRVQSDVGSILCRQQTQEISLHLRHPWRRDTAIAHADPWQPASWHSPSPVPSALPHSHSKLPSWLILPGQNQKNEFWTAGIVIISHAMSLIPVGPALCPPPPPSHGLSLNSFSSWHQQLFSTTLLAYVQPTSPRGCCSHFICLPHAPPAGTGSAGSISGFFPLAFLGPGSLLPQPVLHFSGHWWASLKSSYGRWRAIVSNHGLRWTPPHHLPRCGSETQNFQGHEDFITISYP